MILRASMLALFLASCLIAGGKPKVTFHKEILPILQARCQSCHRPGEAAPFALLTYQQARPWAKAMREAVLTRKMPPWFAAPDAGHFKNDRRLSQQEIDTLAAWADSGAPEGKAAGAPKPLEFVEGWTIGKPDVVFEMPQAYDVPATGIVDYQWIRIPTHFTEDRWIQAVECRPGERAQVHHIVAFWRRADSKWMADAPIGVPIAKASNSPEGGMSNGILGDYVPGMPGMIFPEGHAMLVPAGADIMFQVHYQTNGKAVQDRSRVGFVFAKEKPAHRILNFALTQGRLKIPPGDPNYRADAQATFDTEVRLLSMNPHMHVRGKAFEIRRVEPQGASETLLKVPKYDFNWQLTYELAESLRLLPGTRIEATAWYDNSANNPNNPDPAKEVTFGDQTSDEMLVAFLHLAFPVDTDVRRLFRRPNQYPEKPASASGAYKRFRDGSEIYVRHPSLERAPDSRGRS